MIIDHINLIFVDHINLIFIDLIKGEFYKNVWTTLKESTKPGDQMSYKSLSQLAVRNTKSSRAVGNAMRNNPFNIIIPCHRVIKSNGDHGNYSGGKDIKSLLLLFEGNFKTTSK